MKKGSTPAIIAAHRAGIPFTIHQYQHDPAATSFGLEAVQALGLNPMRVFKTLVVDVDRSQLVVAIVPVAAQLNVKALAAAVDGKKGTMAEIADAQRATGYVIGGISPLGQRKRLPTVLNTSALDHATIYVSAGQRGLEIELTPADLIALTQAIMAPIAQ